MNANLKARKRRTRLSMHGNQHGPMSASTTPITPASKPRPAYTMTIILAAALFGFDGLFSGQGIFSMFTLIFGVPVLLIRALLAWKNPPLRRHRFAVAGIYLVAALATMGMVSADQRGANLRARQLIAACEEFKKATGAYPMTLGELTPRFVPAIPSARRLGMMTQSEFRYFATGTNDFLRITNSHVLIYMTLPPFMKTYYVFEEGRWGSYD